MKRFLSALMLVALLSAALMAANAEAQMTGEFTDFTGRWADPNYDRASLRIMRCYEVDAPEDELWYDVQITWPESASTETVWYMAARYDAQTTALDYTDGVKATVTYGEDGNIVSEEKLWDDSEGALIYIDGKLMWADKHEDQLRAEAGEQNMMFERIPRTAPEAEDFAENYFLPVARVELDTAGSTLKQAIVAHDILRFAYENALWDADPKGMRDNMLAAYEALSDEERAGFDDHLLSVIAPVLDDAFGNYDSVAGLFDDAGVDEDMSILSENAEARESWRTLLGNTLTLGNDDEAA